MGSLRHFNDVIVTEDDTLRLTVFTPDNGRVIGYAWLLTCLLQGHCFFFILLDIHKPFFMNLRHHIYCEKEPRREGHLYSSNYKLDNLNDPNEFQLLKTHPNHAQITCSNNSSDCLVVPV